MVRDEGQASEVEALGIDPVVADLTREDEVREAVEGCDAAVFAAGSGGDDVWGVDRDGAVNLVDACEDAGADRFVMLSAIGADTPEAGPDALEEYLEAKSEADDYLRESDLTYTVVRPGELTNEPGTGRVRTGADLDATSGDIPRPDVAAVLVETLGAEATHGETFELLSGEVPIAEAVADPFGE
ncbi:NmrA family protein [Candidatus Halobonum tyrrellensis G22]|uniref:NmrA family protein n=2 Tax=Candidatus Halobonum TaxID=1431544 RepID=V4IW70_9EURY|nr:NmrA family protein [Candidatus Halobonum tyrrellensis G22]